MCGVDVDSEAKEASVEKRENFWVGQNFRVDFGAGFHFVVVDVEEN